METFDFKMKNYDLHVIKTKKFKTISLNIDVIFEDDKENMKYNSLLRYLLLHTNSKYESIRETNIACLDIYDPSYRIDINYYGKENILHLSSVFINEKYTKKGMNEKTIKFLLDIIFKPKIVDGGFDKEIFETHKNKIINHYKNLKDNPENYASFRINELMDIHSYKMPSLKERISMIESINEKDLYKFYKKIMKNGKLNIFVAGDVEPNKIKEIFEKNINFEGKENKQNEFIVKQTSYNKKPNIVIESGKYDQSNLEIGCKVLDTTKFEHNYVSNIFTGILGGGSTSLLFKSVREEKSLCYTIGAAQDKFTNAMYIYTGIDADKYEEVLNQVDIELENIKNGNFSDEMLENTKMFYISSLKRTLDEAYSVSYNYRGMLYFGVDDLEKRAEQISRVTKEDVMKFAHKVHIDTIFLLKGEK